MVPTPQANETHPTSRAPELRSETVVISGISVTVPNGLHMKDFSDILYNKVNPVTNSKVRWDYKHPEVPKHHGKVPKLDRFDAQFFKVSNHLARCMDPMGRKLLEHTHRAIYDAGLSADCFAGRNVGVYIGSSVAENEKVSIYDPYVSAHSMPGCSKSMFANRISYWLDVKGPSMSFDDACCSSLVALEQAYHAIRRGDCEAAIVGGAYVALHAQTVLQYGRIIPLCEDGKVKSFDEQADGCVMSDAISVVLLQRAENALRIYAELVYVKSEYDAFHEDQNGHELGFKRDSSHLTIFLQGFYEDAKVSPNEIEYVEAFGSGIPEMDRSELEAIERVFCKERKTKNSLLVGSVTSNIGFTEAASALCGIAKVALGYQKGMIAGNLHCTSPRRDVAALRYGHMRILTEHEPFRHSYAAINDFSITGVNGHILLREFKERKDATPKPSIPYLVTVSGRKESCVQNVIDDLKVRPVDRQELALLHNIHEEKNSGHLARGFVVLDTNEGNATVCLSENVAYYDDVKRPLWFVYSGMGSQWAGMGTQLMRIPTFAAAIQRCHRALSPKGLDIIHILTSPDKTIYDNILHSFVGIAAVQIGLTDVLRDLGLVPDGIIGHSVGELGCAYADGCFTAEEMILAAYYRGLVSIQTEFIFGSMAAVGIGYQQAVKLCPSEIEVACHNGPDSCTISGPAEVMREFVIKLTKQGIFAKEVPCSNIAYHSRYIEQAGPKLLEYLSDVIQNPKRRSERWVSTSVPQERWSEENALYSSAWYHTNNLLSPVLFEETSRLVPAGAVLLEVAPHGLLQAILKRSLHPDCRHIPLTKRGHPDNALFLLQAVGKLFTQGYNPKVKSLYSKVEFPVSIETPSLSHLVEWNDSDKWTLLLCKTIIKEPTCICKFLVSIHDEENNYLRGNFIRGRILYPYSAVLVSVWDTLAMSSGVQRKAMSVQFSDVHLYTQPILHDKRHLQLKVAIHRGTGEFEVTDYNSKVASGFICALDSDLNKQPGISNDIITDMGLDSNGIYELLKEKDCYYSGEFRSIYKCNNTFTEAQLLWKDNWVTFIDGIVQISALQRGHSNVSCLRHIHKLTINLKDHNHDKMQKLDDNTLISSDVSPILDCTRCGGILMEKLIFEDILPVQTNNLTLTTLRFISRHHSVDVIDLTSQCQLYLQTVAKEVNSDIINVVSISNNKNYNQNTRNLKATLKNIPSVSCNYENLDLNHFKPEALTQADVVLTDNLYDDQKLINILKQNLKPNTFIIDKEKSVANQNLPSNFELIDDVMTNSEKLDLICWKPEAVSSSIVVFVRTQSDIDSLAVKRATMSSTDKLVVVSAYLPVQGLTELVRKWRKDTDRNNVCLVLYAGKKNLENISVDYSSITLALTVIKDDIVGGEYYVPWEDKLLIKDTMLKSENIGDLNSLHWVKTPQKEKSSTDLLVEVHYAGINVLDCNVATGVVSLKQGVDKHCYGMDCSGITETGSRVMGLVRGGAAGSRVRAVPALTWPVPAHWTLEDAATVPLAYAQAFYCLGIKSPLHSGMTILVQGGSGALGQAVISIALALQCKVFTTVKDASKKKFLLKLFPELTEDFIGCSRDHSFADLVLLATEGRGCDIIICCATGKLKNVTLKCGAFSSIIIDTVQAHIKDSYNYGMYYLTNQRSYVIVDFFNIFDNEHHMKKIQLMMSEGIARGYVKPLSRVTYDAQESTRAFRLLAASQHRGRVLLRVKHDSIRAQPRLTRSSELHQLVVCNKDYFSFQLIDRLVNCGAKKLILYYCPSSALFHYKKESWKNLGVKIQTFPGDKTTVKDFKQVLSNNNTEGIFIVCSGNQQDDSVASNLDMASRSLCPALKCFTIISTANNLVGENICVARENMSLPASMVYLLPKNKKETTNLDFVSQLSVMDVVERALVSKQRIMKIYRQPATETTLLEKIAELADINLPAYIKETTTLKDLGLNNSYSPMICSFLRNSYNISTEIEQIPTLTVSLLKQYEENTSEPDFKEVEGLATFYSHVGRDELLAVSNMVTVPTLFKCFTVTDDMIDLDQQYLWIVPGLEGSHERFRTFCERLKIPALILQPGLDSPNETVEETARKYIEVVTTKTGINKHNTFYILGYETGIFVAFEMAAIMERNGMTGTVFCVGGDPRTVSLILEDKLKHFNSDEALQDAIVHHMITLLCGGVDCMNKNEKAITWQKKLDEAVEHISINSSKSTQYVRALLEATYIRTKNSIRQKLQQYQLKSEVILLHSLATKDTSRSHERLWSEKPVKVYELQVPLAHAMQHPQCASIINSHLGFDVIQDYETQNHCEALTDPDMFVSKFSTGQEDED